MRIRSLMMGKESTEESKKEMSRRPGAPSPPANAMIFCFQPLRLSDNRNSRRQPCPSSRPQSFPAKCRRESFLRHSEDQSSREFLCSRATAGPSSESLRKRGSVEVVHEDLHQRGAVKIRKARYFADHPDVSKPLYGFAVLAVLVANQNDAVHRQLGRVQSRQRQQRVIDGPRTAARRKYYR